MAIFRCVGYFYFRMSEGSCFFFFFAFFSRGHTLHVSICIFPSLILLLFAFVFVCLLFLCCLSVTYCWHPDYRFLPSVPFSFRLSLLSPVKSLFSCRSHSLNGVYAVEPYDTDLALWRLCHLRRRVTRLRRSRSSLLYLLYKLIHPYFYSLGLMSMLYRPTWSSC
jgi:hypothetical protein